MGAPNLASTIKTQNTNWVYNNGYFAQTLWQAGPNGARIAAITMANSGSTPSVKLFRGMPLTDNSVAYPGARPGLGLTPILSVGSTTTIARTNGSFLVDGWMIGQPLIIVNDTVTPTNNVQCLIHASTAPTATTITLAAASPATATTLGPRAVLLLPSLLGTLTAVTNAGNTSGTLAQAMLNNTILPSVFNGSDAFLTLGPNEYLVGVISAALTTGTYLSLQVDGAEF